MWKVKSGDCGTEKVASWDGDFFSILLLKNVNVFLFSGCTMQHVGFLNFFYGILSDTFIDWCAAPEAIVRRENIFLPRSDENEVL